MVSTLVSLIELRLKRGRPFEQPLFYVVNEELLPYIRVSDRSVGCRTEGLDQRA